MFFNVYCFFGMSMSLTHHEEDMNVWVPSTIASICFVASSWLSLVEAEGRWFSWRPRQLEWWITVGSLLGPHGETLWLEYVVDGVLLAGSLWFLVSTYLMIPEALRAAREGTSPSRKSP